MSNFFNFILMIAKFREIVFNINIFRKKFMILNHTTAILSQFHQQVQNEIDSIENTELSIIFALNDLLDEPDTYEANFINKSLEYLKNNYGLNKSVWKVLLKLNSKIENFCDILSEWKEPMYIGYSSSSEFDCFTYAYPVGEHRLGDNKREHNIKKLFVLISVLCEKFGVEEASQYVGLFISELDIKESTFSINNLYLTANKLRKENSDDNISIYDVNFFAHQFSLHSTIYNSLRGLHFNYIDYINKRKNINQEYLNKNLEERFTKLGIASVNPIETLITIVATYKKYTRHPFITYQGLVELKNKTLNLEDEYLLQPLLKEFEKSEKMNLARFITTIEMIRFMKPFENQIIRGLEKRQDLRDYTGSEHYIEKIFSSSNINLKNILEWSNEWHLTPESLPVVLRNKKQFYVYDIDKKIGDYIFTQVKDSYQLYQEGKSQKHCVYTYSKECENGECIIISMTNLTHQKVSTIRLQKGGKISSFIKNKTRWNLVENRRKCNKSCNEDEKKAANQYFESIKEKLQ